MFEMFKSWKQKKEVMSFYCHPELEDVIPKPEPGLINLPRWFKDLEPSSEGFDKFGHENMTAKKCLPLIDAMSLGYIIKLAGDVRIRSNKDCTQIDHLEQPSLKLIEYHTEQQVGGNHILRKNQGPIIKFVNHWVIKTAPGWSTLFEPLPNVFDSPFTCFSGLVDTDQYPKIVNFPAIWNLPNANILLKAGTPLVRVIPIERKSIKKMKKCSVVRKMTQEEFLEISKIEKIQQLRNNYYTHDLRVKK